MANDDEVKNGAAGESQNQDGTGEQADSGRKSRAAARADEEQQDRGRVVAEQQVDQAVAEIQSGEAIALTSLQRPPEETDRLRWEREGSVVHDGFIRPGDVNTDGLPATSIHARMAEMPAREWQVTPEVLASPGFQALTLSGQQAIDQLLIRPGAVVRANVLVVPISDPSFAAERELRAGDLVPDDGPFLPVNYIDRSRRQVAGK